MIPAGGYSLLTLANYCQTALPLNQKIVRQKAKYDSFKNFQPGNVTQKKRVPIKKSPMQRAI
jgi:hypothetical protein